MKVTFFIDRPVFSAVISIVIVIVGIIGLTMLPVDQYPQITPPVVKISASYPAAPASILMFPAPAEAAGAAGAAAGFAAVRLGVAAPDVLPVSSTVTS